MENPSQLARSRSIAGRVGAVILFLLLAGAAFGGDVKLQSGRILKDAIIGPVYSTKSTFPQMIALQYETTTNAESKRALLEEVAEVWSMFKQYAENGHYGNATIIVTNPPTPIIGQLITTASQHKFGFEKRGKDWMMLPYPWNTDSSVVEP